MNQCVILTIDNNQDEPNYAKMILLLVNSIRMFNKDIPIYIGIFTNRIIDKDIIDQLQSKKYNCTIIFDQYFCTEANSINYFLRNFCKFYFSNIYNLLDIYSQLIYLDIDVILLDDVSKLKIGDYDILVEEVPESIKKLEEPYIGRIDHPLYYNWYDIITSQNKFIFDIDYKSNTYLKDTDIIVSKNINSSDLNIIHQTDGAYYPKHKLMDKTILFHYDGFIDSGTFYKLEEFNLNLYKRLYLYITQILKIKIDNSINYWEDLCLEN